MWGSGMLGGLVGCRLLSAGRPKDWLWKRDGNDGVIIFETMIKPKRTQ